MHDRTLQGCAGAREGLGAWTEGTLPGPERERFAAHFAACAACDGERRRAEALRSALQVPALEAADLPARVLRRIGGRSPRDLAWQEAQPAIRRLAATAALLFLVAGGFAFFSPAAADSLPAVAAAGPWNGAPDEPSLNHEREILLALVLPEVLR